MPEIENAVKRLLSALVVCGVFVSTSVSAACLLAEDPPLHILPPRELMPPAAEADCEAFLAAAREGSVAAKMALSRAHSLGTCVESDLERAIALMEEAAEAGSFLAVAILPFAYVGDDHVEGDPDRARYWFRRLVERLAESWEGVSEGDLSGALTETRYRSGLHQALAWWRDSTAAGRAAVADDAAPDRIRWVERAITGEAQARFAWATTQLDAECPEARLFGRIALRGLGHEEYPFVFAPLIAGHAEGRASGAT